MARAVLPALVGLLCLLLPARAAPPEPGGWIAQLKPQVNPELADLPDNTWKLMKPKGDTFDHPKTEV